MRLMEVFRTKAWAQQLDPNGSSGVSVPFLEMSYGCIISAARCRFF
jgi:hypothetical protein